MSQNISREKYGLLNLLQTRLRNLYEIGYKTVVDYDKIRLLKQRISDIQNEILEGVKIRAKVDDFTQGEKMSMYLLGREKKRNISFVESVKRKDGSVVHNPEGIAHCIKEHFEKLFSAVDVA